MFNLRVTEHSIYVHVEVYFMIPVFDAQLKHTERFYNVHIVWMDEI